MSQKEIQVVMLPTDKVTKILYNKSNNRYKTETSASDWYLSQGYKFQHLYFLSDDDIEVGDWVLVNKKLVQAEENEGTIGYNSSDMVAFLYFRPNHKKVLASTNDFLELPKPNNSFIDHYCKICGINKVLVEYEIIKIKTGQYSYLDVEELKLSKMNEIEISQPIYSPEIMELLEKAHWFGWVAREKLESPDKFPYDKFPHGLDYEESEDFCFKQFLDKFNIKQ